MSQWCTGALGVLLAEVERFPGICILVANMTQVGGNGMSVMCVMCVCVDWTRVVGVNACMIHVFL